MLNIYEFLDLIMKFRIAGVNDTSLLNLVIEYYEKP